MIQCHGHAVSATAVVLLLVLLLFSCCMRWLTTLHPNSLIHLPASDSKRQVLLRSAFHPPDTGDYNQDKNQVSSCAMYRVTCHAAMLPTVALVPNYSIPNTSSCAGCRPYPCSPSRAAPSRATHWPWSHEKKKRVQIAPMTCMTTCAPNFVFERLFIST
jgi:hypothetical protein